jgi:hypothetical protein
MNQKEYEKARKAILRQYAEIEKRYIHQQVSSAMLQALQHERNNQLIRLTRIFHEAIVYPF